jgi:hypothetical protein
MAKNKKVCSCACKDCQVGTKACNCAKTCGCGCK